MVGVDEENGDDVGGPFTKHNIHAPLGVTGNTRSRIEVPKEFLKRTLIKDEVIVGQYDFYYTKKRMHVTDIILYSVYTGGMFFMAYLAYKLYHFIRSLVCCFILTVNLLIIHFSISYICTLYPYFMTNNLRLLYNI